MHHSVTLFGADGRRFLESIYPLVDELRSSNARYAWMETAKFQALATQDNAAGMSIYWSEILGRAHLAAAASIIRSYQWCAGMNASYEAQLFLPYCASFRGLLESVADTHDSLNNVALTLARSHADIERALSGKMEAILVSSELENALIHFSFARRVGKSSGASPTHIAKTAADYFRSVASIAPFDVNALYGELCQLTHPAAPTVHYLLDHENGDTAVFSANREKLFIEMLASANKGVFPWLLMYAFNSSILLLKVLRSFNRTEYHVRYVERMTAESMPAWKTIAAHLPK